MSLDSKNTPANLCWPFNLRIKQQNKDPLIVEDRINQTKTQTINFLKLCYTHSNKKYF
jgi:hypothetical protein